MKTGMLATLLLIGTLALFPQSAVAAGAKMSLDQTYFLREQTTAFELKVTSSPEPGMYLTFTVSTKSPPAPKVSLYTVIRIRSLSA